MATLQLFFPIQPDPEIHMTTTATKKSIIKQFETNAIRNALAIYDNMVDTPMKRKLRNARRRDAEQMPEEGPINTKGFNREGFARSRFLLEMANLPKRGAHEALIKRGKLEVHRGREKENRDLIWTGIFLLDAAGADTEMLANELIWTNPVFANYN